MAKKICIFSVLLVLIITCCGNVDENKKMIFEARSKYVFLDEFLSEYSEENLLLVMKFVNHPDNYFEDIKNIPGVFNYFFMLERLAIKDERFSKFWFGNFLKRNFDRKKITTKKAEMLTFLLLNSDGYVAEMLADEYTKLFSKSSDIFVNYLSKEPDWMKIVYSLDAGDWETFKTAVEKLKDSGFEGEFKRFVLAPLDKEGKRIIK